MSAYGSSAYGSQPIDATTSLDLVSGSTLVLRSDGKFVLVDGPLTLMRPVTFGDGVLTRISKQRDLYAGEIYVYEEHFFSVVDEDYKPSPIAVTYIAVGALTSSTLSLGTQTASGFLTSRIEGSSGATTLSLGTQSASPNQTGYLDNNIESVWVDNNLGGTLVDANA